MTVPSPRPLREALGRYVRGKDDAIGVVLAALVAGGHVLLEDVPGVGKTTLARAIAGLLGLEYRRLQFTSDLLPADVVGGSVFDRERNVFVFRPGPVFANVLLADEINRTTPKTQSALLEAMGEGQVSIDGTTHPLPSPFFVLATQNPIDFYGTYPLPESQLDRFLVRLRLGYPPREVERELLRTRRDRDPLEGLAPVLSASELRAMQAAVADVRIDDAIVDYLHAIVLATRQSPLLEVGASTRAAIAFERVVRARALVEGRTHVLPDDVKLLAPHVLAHRLRSAGDGARDDAERALAEILERVPVPL
ncbi:MAG: MoxR family ATPase [Myxococcota bacterium]|jgi:MoxR-like ATPase|nr:MoxR family ATPase [Myxococcota bacterium]